MDNTPFQSLRVVVVNGHPESGKTTFEKICKEIMGAQFCQICSTIDIIKEIATIGRWDGSKDPRSRKFLSDLKDLFTEYNDAPLHSIEDAINNFEYDLKTYDVDDFAHVLFVDCREPKEIEKLKQKFNAITLLIRRPTTKNEFSNHADAEVENYNYDCIIDNDGSLEELKNKAEGFLDLIFS